MSKLELIKNTFLGAMAAAGAAVCNALGGWDSALQALLLFMALDYITGLVCAVVFKKSVKTQSGAADSSICFKGLVKKVAVLVCIIIAVRLDALTNGGNFGRNSVILFFMGNEGLSILENLGLMGVPLPAFIKSALELLKRKGNEGEN